MGSARSSATPNRSGGCYGDVAPGLAGATVGEGGTVGVTLRFEVLGVGGVLVGGAEAVGVVAGVGEPVVARDGVAVVVTLGVAPAGGCGGGRTRK